MKRKILSLGVLIISALFLGSCKSGDSMVNNELNIISRTTVDKPFMTSIEKQEYAIMQFIKDTNLPVEIYEKFSLAVKGDLEAQKWLDNYKSENRGTYFGALYSVFPYKSDDLPYLEKECYLNIGLIYLNGDHDVPIKQNKEKAYYWLELSANKDSMYGSIYAGDMLRSGDGIRQNHNLAFKFYKKALKIKVNSKAYERLANCYEMGIGTEQDLVKANQFNFMSALDGNLVSLYKLSDSREISEEQSLLISKAVSSLDYSADYFEMVYGRQYEYDDSSKKVNVINRLSDTWNKGTDSVVKELKKSASYNNYFNDKFVDELAKASYTYSYHNFADKYGVLPNRSFTEIKKDRFDFSGSEADLGLYLDKYFTQDENYSENELYELDFDGDGENEIGISICSGAGGALMADIFIVFKKNSKGLYERFSEGPDCAFRDAMRIIKYDGIVYFITNPYSDTGDAPNNITAEYIGKDGIKHSIQIDCKNYRPKEIMSRKFGNYNSVEFNDLFKAINIQGYDATSATKNQVLYNPNKINDVKKVESDLSANFVNIFNDIYFAADYDNDGLDEFIRKGHWTTHGKYYNDYNIINIYNDESELVRSPVSMLNLMPNDDYYGQHSAGNIYESIPVMGNIVQFWTVEHADETYCISLTRNGLLYSLQVYHLKDKKATPVYIGLYFDEVHKFEITYN